MIKTRLITLSALVALVSILDAQLRAAPLGTAFSYQGRLSSGTNVANGRYDLKFSLYDASSDGGQVGSSLTNAALSVTNGLFTVALDFGDVFNGEARWLEIGVRTNGVGAFSPLSPRQPLTPAPYALFAPDAGVAVTAMSADAVASGAVGPAGLQNGAVDSSKIADESISNSDLSPTLLNSTFWKLLGNGGTTAGVNFLGTTDDEPLELKVYGQRALRLEPTSGAPNFIAGYSNNQMTPYGVKGVAIGGGATNRTDSSFGTIGGGSANSIQDESPNGTIGGGENNRINRTCPFSTIAGGRGNLVNEATGTIGGGEGNGINWGDYATIAGGRGNQAGGIGSVGVSYPAIGGGGYNFVVSGSANTISGGFSNRVGKDWPVSSYATIGGGLSNTNTGSYAVISGGCSNVASGDYTSIPGGQQAKASTYGQMAYASGAFGLPGDAQTSIYVCRNTTSDAAQTELFLDGASDRMNIAANSTRTFDILITGRTSAGTSAGYQILGVIENNGGTTALVGSLTKTVLAEDTAAWDATIAADDANDALVVKVTGAASTNIRWVATVRTVEVSY